MPRLSNGPILGDTASSDAAPSGAGNGQPQSAPVPTASTPAPAAESVSPAPDALKPAKYFASIFPGKKITIPVELGTAFKELEGVLGMPVWLLVQCGAAPDELDDMIVEAFATDGLPEGQPITLIIDSPGGYAKCAYQIAMTIRHRCGSFTAVVPRYAKSAATLLVLGAQKILLATDAELGPLDAQLEDPEREERISALDEVQSLERLHAFALEAVDRSMFLLTPRTRKKVETLLPHVLKFVADMTRPLFEKIDIVHWTQMSRMLKVAEEYAIRLLQPRYSEATAKRIARHLVENYPEHGFVVDRAEAKKFGLETSSLPDDAQAILDAVQPRLKQITIIGRVLEEVKP